MNIEKEELVRRLKIAEPYNNKNVPQYVWNIINAIPDAERVGKWVNKGDYIECSRCGCLAPSSEYADGMLWKLSSFCPDCGAKMEGEQNDKG